MNSPLLIWMLDTLTQIHAMIYIQNTHLQFDSHVGRSTDNTDRHIANIDVKIESENFPTYSNCAPLDDESAAGSTVIKDEQMLVPIDERMVAQLNKQVVAPPNELLLAPPIERMLAPPIERMLAPPIERMLAPPIERMLAPPIERMIAPPIEQVVAPPIERVLAAMDESADTPAAQSISVTEATAPPETDELTHLGNATVTANDKKDYEEAGES